MPLRTQFEHAIGSSVKVTSPLSIETLRIVNPVGKVTAHNREETKTPNTVKLLTSDGPKEYGFHDFELVQSEAPAPVELG